jgi:hypothetical protein
MEPSSCDEFVRDAPGLHAERSRSWGAVSAAVITRTKGEVTWRSDHHRVIVSLTAVRGTACVDGGSLQTAQFAPGEASFAPAGVSIRTIFPAARLMRTLQSPGTYHTIISEMIRGGIAHFETRFPIVDPLVSQMVSTLSQELGGAFLDPILVDSAQHRVRRPDAPALRRSIEDRADARRWVVA